MYTKLYFIDKCLFVVIPKRRANFIVFLTEPTEVLTNKPVHLN